MKFFFTSSWLLLVLATPSALVVAKKGKKTKNTKNKNNLGPLPGVNRACDPMNRDSNGCEDEDRTSDVWKDGCAACMCLKKGNASWCDGAQSVYYDVYFEEHGKNPFGDTNYSNRKCNTKFSQEFDVCRYDWECGDGLIGCFVVYADLINKNNVCIPALGV